MKSTYKTSPQVCSQSIEIETEGNIVKSVRFIGGCHGNTQGISKLVEGMEIEDVINRLKDIRCGRKDSSCPAELAKALSTLNSAE